MFVSDLI